MTLLASRYSHCNCSTCVFSRLRCYVGDVDLTLAHDRHSWLRIQMSVRLSNITRIRLLKQKKLLRAWATQIRTRKPKLPG